MNIARRQCSNPSRRADLTVNSSKQRDLPYRIFCQSYGNSFPQSKQTVYVADDLLLDGFLTGCLVVIGKVRCW
jgi:hypothetical protein